MTKHSWNAIIFGGVGIAAGALVVVCICIITPATRLDVKVDIRGLPAKTRFVCVACDLHGKMFTMKGIGGTGFLSAEADPARWTGSYAMEGYPIVDEWKSIVAWREGDRYSVVTWDDQGLSRITWFPSSVRKGNEAIFDLRQAVSAALTEEQIAELGLDKAIELIRANQSLDGK